MSFKNGRCRSGRHRCKDDARVFITPTKDRLSATYQPPQQDCNDDQVTGRSAGTEDHACGHDVGFARENRQAA